MNDNMTACAMMNKTLFVTEKGRRPEPWAVNITGTACAKS
ncbi:hypothetical protein FHX77_000796 [Bifidobacterium commune]|uniref:Uncharacterized protein n=1 Tax=Bifidobacterium commune TaxID=1505727 RepID=A0A1C4H5H9_9BIFI|nr:hypothetical protein [Bifidobacterium commune]SCC80167.1 hypothetical protein GA0061077_1090 [Bifidobacterium commune]